MWVSVVLGVSGVVGVIPLLARPLIGKLTPLPLPEVSGPVDLPPPRPELKLVSRLLS